MSQYLFSLAKYKTPKDNIICSGCGEKRARPYVNNATGERLGDHVSRCERVDSCGYHYTPKMFFEENPDKKPLDFKKWESVPAPPPRSVSFIDNSIFKKTLGVNNNNTFISFLILLFGKERAENLANRYHIGTTKNGETIFYQVDLQGNVRSGKVIKYNITDSTETSLGKDCNRGKIINWVHSKLKLENFNLNQCLFGEDLITDNQTIAIVESAKSAVIASVYFPQLIWVSCEGKEGLGIEKLKVLKGKNVILFPDLSKITEKKEPTAFELWTEKAKQMTFCKSVVVSDLLERVATDAKRARGLDLADYCLEFPAPAETVAVATDTPESVTVKNDSLENLPQPDCEVVISDLPEEIPFWEDIPQISDAEFKEKCEVLDWWNNRLNLFEKDSFMVVDGVAIPDIQSVINKHVKAIHNDNSSAVLSLKFLEKVKKLIT